jgi:L-ribulose-5-phosphate 3-epimerase
MNSPFRVAVITDEITQDFGRALEIASKDFGMDWVEIRGLWNKNIMALDAKEIAEARRLLEQFHLRVTDIGSPLFKVDWPGAPLSSYSPQRRDSYNADYTFAQQDEVLERSIELARAFQTDRVRGFDFWRLNDPGPYRAAMDEKLIEASREFAKANIIFILENEYECNTATSSEALRTLNAVSAPNFMLNWDPGNAAMRGDPKVFPDGYNRLPFKRIGHVHVKDCERKPDGSGFQWAAMGKGMIDWTGQFRALKDDGYHFTTSLETHWHGAATPEASTRICWAAMKDDLQKAGALS